MSAKGSWGSFSACVIRVFYWEILIPGQVTCIADVKRFISINMINTNVKLKVYLQVQVTKRQLHTLHTPCLPFMWWHVGFADTLTSKKRAAYGCWSVVLDIRYISSAKGVRNDSQILQSSTLAVCGRKMANKLDNLPQYLYRSLAISLTGLAMFKDTIIR